MRHSAAGTETTGLRRCVLAEFKKTVKSAPGKVFCKSVSHKHEEKGFGSAL